MPKQTSPPGTVLMRPAARRPCETAGAHGRPWRPRGGDDQRRQSNALPDAARYRRDDRISEITLAEFTRGGGR